ncbi:hypothetical protein M0804_015041 [Polistes exclamans]|nr:hypothetical protein M0804_015042 [Polistes exclamans]KAI4474033.1 hypothetical protein M0804_015041 [Polistes exclamans]
MIGVQFGPGQAVKCAEVQTTRKYTIGTAALPEINNIHGYYDHDDH